MVQFYIHFFPDGKFAHLRQATLAHEKRTGSLGRPETGSDGAAERGGGGGEGGGVARGSREEDEETTRLLVEASQFEQLRDATLQHEEREASQGGPIV